MHVFLAPCDRYRKTFLGTVFFTVCYITHPSQQWNIYPTLDSEEF